MAKKSGTCLLTGDKGPMAKSHIIPDAFLQRATDAPFMECDVESRPRKAFSGWYDTNILGHRGEKIIGDYDDVAAKAFIENGFTYRRRRHPYDINRLVDGFIPGQIYEITSVDTGKLRLFALSLLWRAAVSQLDAFKLVQVSPSHLEDLRKRILTGEAGSFEEYPVYFGVFCGGEELTKMAPHRRRNHPFFRFFLDGVVCYVCPRRRLKGAEDMGELLTGSLADRIKLPCFASIGSAHELYTAQTAQQIAAERGDIFAGFAEAASRRRR